MIKINEIFKKSLIILDWILGFFALGAVFSLMLVHLSSAVLDLDIWLHLKTGEFIFQHKFIPVNDIFSFTFSGKPWIDHEWIFQLLAYFSFSQLGPDGLIYLEIFGIASAFLILALACRRFIGAYLESAVIIFIAFSASTSRFNIRPEVFSILFFCIYLYLLEFSVNKKTLWLILPIQVIWVNLHGYFFLGPVVIIFYILGEFLRRKIKFLPQAWQSAGALDERAYRRLKLILLLTIGAAFINPQGVSGAAYPLQVLLGIFSAGGRIAFGYIQELKPVFDLEISSFQFYYLLAGIYFGVLLLNIKRLKVRDVLFALFFFPFGIMARNVLFFTAVSVMGIAYYGGEFLNRIKECCLKENNFKQLRYQFIRCILAIFFLNFVCFETFDLLRTVDFDLVAQKSFRPFFGLSRTRYPQETVDFILQHPIPARMFNDFNSGAYLIGRTFPRRQVFIDGRSEFYGADFFTQYQKAEDGDIASIEALIKKYNLEAFLLNINGRKARPLAGYLYKNPQWKLVFIDSKSILFLKDIPDNRGLIKEHKINFKKYKVPALDLKKIGLNNVYPAPYINRANLFEVFGLDNLVMAEAKEALRISPSCWQAYLLLGRAYARAELYTQAWESLRQAAIFSPRNKNILEELTRVAAAEKKKNNKISCN